MGFDGFSATERTAFGFGHGYFVTSLAIRKAAPHRIAHIGMDSMQAFFTPRGAASGSILGIIWMLLFCIFGEYQQPGDQEKADNCD